MEIIELPVSLQRALKACRTLPSVPTVVLQVLDLTRDEDISIDKIVKVIANDPALSGKVLRVANSPLYGVRAQVTTLSRAISLLGINATLSLALSFSLVRGLKESTSVEGFDHQFYWRRSATSATAARAIAAYSQKVNPDELFLAGLLQDIGMLVLNEAIPDTYGSIVATADGDHLALVKIERKELETDHAQVGSWLLTEWNLPEKLRDAIKLSHNSDGIRHSDHFTKSVIVASGIAEIWTNPVTSAATTVASNLADSLLQITPEHFDTLLGEIAAALPEATEMLNIDIGGQVSVDRLLDQARESLVELSLLAQQQASRAKMQAVHDEVTTLYNRSYLNEYLPQQFERCRQKGQPFSVIFLDIDNFKNVNDSYGHYMGDIVLRSVGEVLRSTTRNLDTVIRYGGDEFVVLLPNSGEQAGAVVAERIRAAIESQSHRIGSNENIRVTVSIGCATMTSGDRFSSAEELLKAADSCLYAAKNNGRNQVVSNNSPIAEVQSKSSRPFAVA